MRDYFARVSSYSSSSPLNDTIADDFSILPIRNTCAHVLDSQGFPNREFF